MSQVANALTARIAAAKRRLLAGGMLQPVEWGIPGEPDVRGRRTFTYTSLDALIEQRPALDRSTFTTERVDSTVVVIFDAVAILTEHTFRWGDPLRIYSIKAVDGVIQDEEDGTRFFSEVVVLR